MWSVDQYKGFFDWSGAAADQEPRYGVFYLIAVPIAASYLFVTWLGWTWPAFTLSIITGLLVIGVITYLSVKRHRREGAQIPEWR